METSDFKAPSHLNTAFGCLTLPAIFLALSTLMIDVSSRTWPQLNFEALPSLIKGPLIAVAFARMYAALA